MNNLKGEVCHPNAQCRDYRDGYCCECVGDYYGNGKECLKRGDRLELAFVKITLKVILLLNAEQFTHNF